jgi:hypothetical protein
MTASLPAPELLRWYRNENFDPPLPVMCLRWSSEEDRLWELPEGLSIQGPPPREFGLRVLRQGDAYSVRLVWDRTALAWESLGRGQLLDSCLRPLLAVLGADLWQLLDQPARAISGRPGRAA